MAAISRHASPGEKGAGDRCRPTYPGVKCTIYVNAIITRSAARDLGVANVRVLRNRDAPRAERVVGARKRGSGAKHRATQCTARDRSFFLLSGVVGARNLTMECRKGRRKGAPILGGLLLAWLLTNGCAVVARNMGECEKVFTIPGRGSLPRVNPPLSFASLRQLRARLQRARGYLRATRTPLSFSRRRDSPQAEASFASRRLSRVLFNLRFKFSPSESPARDRSGRLCFGKLMADGISLKGSFIIK